MCLQCTRIPAMRTLIDNYNVIKTLSKLILRLLNDYPDADFGFLINLEPLNASFQPEA